MATSEDIPRTFELGVMMGRKQRYDSATKSVWVLCDTDGDTLVPNDELRTWVAALKSGETSDGKDLSAVNYVFSDRESAEYNQQPLGFSNIGTYVGSLDNPVSLGDAPSFDTKEDFGV